MKELEYFKREILKGSSRQQKYFEELIILYKQKDLQIDRLRLELKTATTDAKTLRVRRDKCFKALVDLQVERRIILGRMNEEQKDNLAKTYMCEETRR